MRRIRNKNPNCNHNATNVFYTPHFTNVKYDDIQQNKEEVLRKMFSNESANIDDLKFAPGSVSHSKSKDAHTHLQIVDHVLAESMYIKDLAGAVAAGQGGRLL